MGGFPFERLADQVCLRRRDPSARSLLGNRKGASHRVVKDNAEREAFAAPDPAHAMAQIDAIGPRVPRTGRSRAAKITVRNADDGRKSM
jgi:hypothetical protein